ncbi:class A beta-lactamase [Streptomyces sp. NPDC101227]|uniref:class A beta-lactamase n=1 Tax=Streptomyces sp. NPDC101227 TaxID=3366136 RepID=UPI0038169782
MGSTALPRRTVLGTGAGLAAGLLAAATGPALAASPRHRPDGRALAHLRHLEREHGARIGAFAHNTATGATVAYRAHTRFAICSAFKTLAAAAVLRDLDRHGETLARRIHYTAADLVDNSPETEKHVATGMTIAELCAAALQRSDNTAGNLLLREIGGPTGITAFARSLGDRTTRLDRWETQLNSAEPWRTTDTTSPYAIARSYARLLVGDALTAADRDRLASWMEANRTNTERFRAGLPKDWVIADKTGSGSYGTGNDVGVAWTADGTPVVLAVLTRKAEQAASYDNPLIRKTAAVLAEAVAA